MIAHTAARLAEVRGMSVDALLDATRENANRLFGLNL
jgi:Tat protein secretion system quality control protein TatD with DNase activity